MNALFFHPKLVHLPMALGALMPLVAGGLLLAWWRTWLPARTWVVAVALQLLLVVSGVVALRSGEAEEERVERVVAERLIEEHEEAAEAFVWASGAALGLMLLGLAMAGRGAGLAAAGAATLATGVVFVLGYRTGEAGGALVYRYGAASAYVGSAAAAAGEAAPPHERDHDHDDDRDDDDE